ncbi:hypothetical protein GDO81_024629 [Engystomops pustulosus]|uniref:Secreted protein n=1 Tax=Engystomops pustulosus TaxID=76066 RepID=A0AAV6YQ65_ENGPU|nr:hypothetical protein GDO81_024629 [Engystomops pustulosus]
MIPQGWRLLLLPRQVSSHLHSIWQAAFRGFRFPRTRYSREKSVPCGRGVFHPSWGASLRGRLCRICRNCLLDCRKAYWTELSHSFRTSSKLSIPR